MEEGGRILMNDIDSYVTKAQMARWNKSLRYTRQEFADLFIDEGLLAIFKKLGIKVEGRAK